MLNDKGIVNWNQIINASMSLIEWCMSMHAD